MIHVAMTSIDLEFEEIEFTEAFRISHDISGWVFVASVERTTKRMDETINKGDYGRGLGEGDKQIKEEWAAG